MKIYLVTDDSEGSIHLAEHVASQVADKPHIEFTIGVVYPELTEDIVELMNRLRDVIKDNGIRADIDSVQAAGVGDAVEHICAKIEEDEYDEIFIDENYRTMARELESKDCTAVLRVVKTYPPVSSIMVRDVITIPANKTVEDAAAVMRREDVGSLVVTEDVGDDPYVPNAILKPLGVVTKGDLVNRILGEGKDPKTTMVRDIMSSPVITTDEDTSVIDASKLMKRNNIATLVITDDGVLKGIATVTDFVESTDEVMRLVSKNLSSVNRFFKRLHYDYLPY